MGGSWKGRFDEDGLSRKRADGESLCNIKSEKL